MLRCEVRPPLFAVEHGLAIARGARLSLSQPRVASAGTSNYRTSGNPCIAGARRGESFLGTFHTTVLESPAVANARELRQPVGASEESGRVTVSITARLLPRPSLEGGALLPSVNPWRLHRTNPRLGAVIRSVALRFDSGLAHQLTSFVGFSTDDSSLSALPLRSSRLRSIPSGLTSARCARARSYCSRRRDRWSEVVGRVLHVYLRQLCPVGSCSLPCSTSQCRCARS